MDGPTKHSVRAWMQHRQNQRAPLPDIAQIRRELGWQRTHAPEPIVRRDDARARDKADH